jgi:uncharacterized membrane protein
MRRRMLRAFGRDRRANFATMTALITPAAIALAAFAIDAGSLYTERRELQSLADLAAISAAANPTLANEFVLATLADNGVEPVRIAPLGPTVTPSGIETVATVRLGRYSEDAALAVGARFVPGATPANAVEVGLRTRGTLFFGSHLMKPPAIAAQGLARTTTLAAFSVGSRLLRVEGGLVNALLGGLVGGRLDLTVMDYEALLKADVGLFDFLDVLAIDLRLTGVTYSELLGSEVRVGQIASALAAVPGMDQRSRLALRTLALAADPKLKLPLGKLLDLGPAGRLTLGGRPAALALGVNALQLISGSAALANGQNQIAVNLGASVPGLLSTRVDLVVGEPAQHSGPIGLGEPGKTVRTAQTRLLVTLEIGGLAGASIMLPVYLELAYAEATLAGVDCTRRDPASVKVHINARPGVAALRVSNVPLSGLKDFSRTPPFPPAPIVKLPLASVNASSTVAIGQMQPKKLTFSKSDIDAGTIKSVSTTQLTQSLAQSLISNLDVSVSVVGLDLGISGPLKSTVLAILQATTPAIDLALSSVLATLGVSVGEADVRVHGATCTRSVLVQ